MGCGGTTFIGGSREQRYRYAPYKVGSSKQARRAADPKTPAAELKALAASATASVRAGVASNPATPKTVLKKLAADDAKLVRQALASNRALPAALATRLASDEQAQVRASLAANPSIPRKILTALLVDKKPDVVGDALTNAQLSTAELATLLEAPARKYLAYRALENPHATDELLAAWLPLSLNLSIEGRWFQEALLARPTLSRGLMLAMLRYISVYRLGQEVLLREDFDADMLAVYAANEASEPDSCGDPVTPTSLLHPLTTREMLAEALAGPGAEGMVEADRERFAREIAAREPAAARTNGGGPTFDRLASAMMGRLWQQRAPGTTALQLSDRMLQPETPPGRAHFSILSLRSSHGSAYLRLDDTAEPHSEWPTFRIAGALVSSPPELAAALAGAEVKLGEIAPAPFFYIRSPSTEFQLPRVDSMHLKWLLQRAAGDIG